MYIDPMIPLSSNKVVTIIVIFTTKPAKEQVSIAEKNCVSLSLKEGEQKVIESQHRFREFLKKQLGAQNIPYSITHSYSTIFNGIAMKLPANRIIHLLNSQEIDAIHLSKEVKLDPPIYER